MAAKVVAIELASYDRSSAIATVQPILPKWRGCHLDRRGDARHGIWGAGPDWNEKLLMTFLMRGVRKALGIRTEEAPVVGRGPYTAPLWLVAPPASPIVPWIWEVPTLISPVSQLCTSEQMEGELFENYCHATGNWPHFHRKLWEYTYIWAAFVHYGVIRPGARVLGFGVGTEPMPAAFARCGMQVAATDAPPEIGESMGWSATNQHASELEAMYRHEMISREEFERLVTFEPVDMNQIPPHLAGFDACWSSCALEHLGSIDAGLDFIENSLATLRPGGVAVHTTEFNLSSNDETFDQYNLAIFRRQDFERLAERLVERGHQVAPLNFYPGSSPVDEHIDLPPYSLPHLKLEVANYVTTSFGMIVTKGEGCA